MTADTGEQIAAIAGVSRETLQRLRVYVDLLMRWNRRINLVGRATEQDVWRRHILDSAQLWRLAPPDADSWADLGSGAGLPGLVIAAIAAERHPHMSIALVDSDQRKCVFLQTAAREMAVSVLVLNQRLESPPPRRFSVVSARALAPAPALFGLLDPWLAPGGMALLPKGGGVERELTDAARDWHSKVVTIPSVVDAAGVVLSVTELRRA